ncbi:MAG: zf-HC2 domain-containing protein [Actinobacteria bacterium]|nr:zf-HC2 domain-containing protein [Actinomycetota bacterium]
MSGERQLTCREVVEIVTDYLEGAMTSMERARFEEHLSACDGCANYLRQMRETIRLTGMLEEDQIPQEQKRELLMAFRGWRRD